MENKFGQYASYVEHLERTEKMSKRMGGLGYAIQKVSGFDYAIQKIIEGCKMQRLGWNGKDQYIELASNISYQRPNGEVVNLDHKMIGNCAIAFYGTAGVQVGWLASQADMLSGDWVEVEE